MLGTSCIWIRNFTQNFPLPWHVKISQINMSFVQSLAQAITVLNEEIIQWLCFLSLDICFWSDCILLVALILPLVWPIHEYTLCVYAEFFPSLRRVCCKMPEDRSKKGKRKMYIFTSAQRTFFERLKKIA